MKYEFENANNVKKNFLKLFNKLMTDYQKDGITRITIRYIENDDEKLDVEIEYCRKGYIITHHYIFDFEITNKRTGWYLKCLIDVYHPSKGWIERNREIKYLEKEK